ncbi:MAG: hypothetical protein LDL39_11430 [Magnetospirillum sp.]|nr:hypothetical protein [Magnetospirillum sp.]
MKRLIHSFYMTLFLGVLTAGKAGQQLYDMWQKDPAGTFQNTMSLVTVTWTVLFMVLLVKDFLSLNGVFDTITDKISRKPRLDVSAALARHAEIGKDYQQSLRKLHDEQPDKAATSAPRSEGGR